MAQSRRRKLVWARNTVMTGVFTATNRTYAFNLLAPFWAQMGILAGPPGITIMRTRIQASSNFVVIGQEPIIATRVQDQNEFNDALGVPAQLFTMNPWADPHADWSSFESMKANYTGPAVDPGSFNSAKDIDIRAMRKVDELGELYMMVVGVPATYVGTATNFSITASVLVALP